MLLQGRSGVVLGIANKRSIAWSCAQAASRHGARLILTYQGERLAESVGKLAGELPGEALTVPCDVSDDASLDRAMETIGEHLPRLDFAVHSIAFAPRELLEGRFADTTREGWRTALEISAFSMTDVSRRLAPLMTEGGSLVTMTYFGSEKVMPGYNVMGPAKAALESSVRYLAADLGPAGVRVNAVSAGPIRTLAASGVAGFGSMLDHFKERAPLRRNVSADEVADATVFLLSDMARGITGSVLWVDAGYHVMAI